MVVRLLNVMSCGVQVATLIRRSDTQYAESLYLNVHDAHFSCIHKLHLYTRSYSCGTCGKMWNCVWDMNRHHKTCIAETRYKYPGGVYHTTASIFDQLRDQGFDVLDTPYPYRATYDFECHFEKTDLPVDSDKVHWKLATSRCRYLSAAMYRHSKNRYAS